MRCITCDRLQPVPPGTMRICPCANILIRYAECEMCCKMRGIIRNGIDAFLGCVCDDCYEAVMSQEPVS